MTNAVEGACIEKNLDLNRIATVAATALRDVVLRLGDQLLGMECKRTDTPGSRARSESRSKTCD